MTTPPPGQSPFGSGNPEPPTQRIPPQVPRPLPQPFPSRSLTNPPSTCPQPVQPPAQPPLPRSPTPNLEPDEPRRRGLFSDPLSIALVLVIVVALALAGLIGAEFYARSKADSIVAKAVSCVVQDSAKASFGMRPFLLQHFSHHYRDMQVETAGNQIREAKGMRLKLRLDDIQMHQTSDSAGTLGALDADITWTSDGIKRNGVGHDPADRRPGQWRHHQSG